jgi:hypothetical protein
LAVGASHQAYFETVAQLIPLLLLVSAIEARTFSGRATGTYRQRAGSILILSFVTEYWVLVQLWGGQLARHTEKPAGVLSGITLIVLSYAIFTVAATPREPKD